MPSAWWLLDALTYAGNLVQPCRGASRPALPLRQGSILDRPLIEDLLESEDIGVAAHLAAESHVDRSIRGPEAFIETNVIGTLRMLEAVRAHVAAHPQKASSFRFLHVSTDEVFGTLGPADPKFSETTPYSPNSPYAASKAASDHLVARLARDLWTQRRSSRTARTITGRTSFRKS